MHNRGILLKQGVFLGDIWTKEEHTDVSADYFDDHFLNLESEPYQLAKIHNECRAKLKDNPKYDFRTFINLMAGNPSFENVQEKVNIFKERMEKDNKLKASLMF